MRAMPFPAIVLPLLLGKRATAANPDKILKNIFSRVIEGLPGQQPSQRYTRDTCLRLPGLFVHV
jgi:hypothetical protein